MNNESDNQRLFRRVLMVLPAKARFLDVYDDAGSAQGTVRLADEGFVNGELVELEVVFVQDLMVFHVRGHIQQQEQGSPLLCIAPFDKRGRDVILQYVNGESDVSVTRRARRFAAVVNVQIANDGPFQTAKTVDLNPAGAHLVSTPVPPKGSLIAVKFADGEGELVINAEVVWLRTIPQESFGVMFLAGEPEKKRRLDAIVAAAFATTRPQK